MRPTVAISNCPQHGQKPIAISEGHQPFNRSQLSTTEVKDFTTSCVEQPPPRYPCLWRLPPMGMWPKKQLLALEHCQVKSSGSVGPSLLMTDCSLPLTITNHDLSLCHQPPFVMINHYWPTQLLIRIPLASCKRFAQVEGFPRWVLGGRWQ